MWRGPSVPVPEIRGIKKGTDHSLSTLASARVKRNIPAGTEQSVPFFIPRISGTGTLGPRHVEFQPAILIEPPVRPWWA